MHAACLAHDLEHVQKIISRIALVEEAYKKMDGGIKRKEIEQQQGRPTAYRQRGRKQKA